MSTQTQTFGVTGLTCGHCVAAVSEEVSELPGVSEAQVDLVAGGTSTLRVTSEAPVDREQIAAAVHEAGEAYQLTDA